MKKNKFLISIFILIVSIFACFNIAIFSSNNAYALDDENEQQEEQDEFIEIESLDEIDKLSGSYKLTKDCVYPTTRDVCLGKFTGKLDGGGHTITYNWVINNNTITYYQYTYSIFSSIEDAEVYNLKFNYNASLSQLYNLTQSSDAPVLVLVFGSDDYSLSNNGGMLANVIKNSTIHNIEIKNANIETLNTTQTAELNLGLIAGVIEGSNIYEIGIDNTAFKCGAEKKDNPDEEEIININTNLNFGFIAGKTLSGTIIRNCVINNSRIDVGIEDCQANNFNLGGVAGYSENTTVKNNIINFYFTDLTSVIPAIKVTSEVAKSINFGGLVGLVSTDKIYSKNNIVFMDTASFELDATLDTSNIGAMFGQIDYDVANTNINGFVTNHSGNIFGHRGQNISNYVNINTIQYNDFNFKDSDGFWCDENDCQWNFDKTWIFMPNEKLPSLQSFEKFSISFSFETSKKIPDSLVELPDDSILSCEITGTNIAYNEELDEYLVEYGSTVYIKLSISEENKFNKFIFISGLELKNSLDNELYDGFVYSNNNGINNNKVQASIYEKTDEYITYAIANFDANCAGEYSAILGRNSFDLSIRVYNVGTDAHPIIPGGFRNDRESNYTNEYTISMLYGERYSFNSLASDKDYSDSEMWYLFRNLTTEGYGSETTFDPTAVTYNFKNNRIEWVFNEDCSLFSGEGFIQTMNIDDYYVDGLTTVDYQLVLVFEKRVKEIRITLKYDNDEEIAKKIAVISIDNRTDRITWNEENGYYVAKIPYDQNEEHLIKIDSMETGYTFEFWQFEIEQLDEAPDYRYAGYFELATSIDEDDEKGEVLQIYGIFKSNKGADHSNLLWLWISLGALAVAGFIGIIILIKRRTGGGGGSSYKKYYY